MSLQPAVCMIRPCVGNEARPRGSRIAARRGAWAGSAWAGGGGGGIPIPAGVGGGGALIILLIFLALQFFGGGGGGTGGLGGLTGQPGAEPGASVDLSNNGDMVEFMGAVLNDTNDLWEDTFQRSGQQYARTRLVLFTGGTQSALRRGELGRPARSIARPTRRSTSTRTSSRSSATGSGRRATSRRRT